MEQECGNMARETPINNNQRERESGRVDNPAFVVIFRYDECGDTHTKVASSNINYHFREVLSLIFHSQLRDRCDHSVTNSFGFFWTFCRAGTRYSFHSGCALGPGSGSSLHDAAFLNHGLRNEWIEMKWNFLNEWNMSRFHSLAKSYANDRVVKARQPRIIQPVCSYFLFLFFSFFLIFL